MRGGINTPLDFGFLTGNSGWVSAVYSSNTVSNIDFTGVYNLIGASVDLPMYSNLTVIASGGLLTDGGVSTNLPTTVDFANTGKISMILPDNVSFTSDSGVFLTTVPEPCSILLLGLGGLVLGRRNK